jgi:hypothetical protein
MTDITDEELQLRQRAKDDFPYFAEKCLKIRPKTGRVRAFKLNAVQRRIHEQAEDQLQRTGKVRKLVLKARQPGVSTYVEGRFYWRTIHAKGLRTFILTHKDEATENLFEMAKRFHANNNPLLQPQTERSNAKELKFGVLDSSYRVGTAKAEGVGRSDTIQLFHGSEVAHWPNAEKHAAGALQAVPNADGTEVWLESTANGASGLFYEMVLQAEAGSGEYELIFIPWFEHNEYQKAVPRNMKFSRDWLDYGSAYDLAPEQLSWAYSKNAELCVSVGGDEDQPCWLFRQEYPANSREAFQTGGADSFIAPQLVAAAEAANYPEPGSETPLVFGVDIAHGGGDKTRFIDRCGRRMGHYLNEVLDENDEMVIAGQLVKHMDALNPDMVFVDITGGYGSGVVDRLKEQHYRNIRGINFGSKAREAETYANKRAEMWTELRDWLKEGADIVSDPILVRDLSAPTAKPDSSGRLILERKDDIRKRLAFSPDVGDASALTFAERVRPKGPQRPAPQRANSNYNPLGRWHA